MRKAQPARVAHLSVASLLLLTALLATSTLAARAEDISGLWRVHRPDSNAKNTDIFLFLTQRKNEIVGSARFSWGELPIRSGGMKGKDLEIRLGSSQHEFRYTGHLDHGTLEMKFSDPHQPDTPVVGTRATVADLHLTPHASLPELHSVAANHLALTPPMGWNSWNHFKTGVDDKVVRETADAMVASGMRDLGYVYITIDDTWEGDRDASGNLKPNEKFPDMHALADYVHSRGLKLGIYSSPGEKTCGGYAGSFGHEEQDAREFASWGIDYLKYDWCTASHIYLPSEAQAAYQIMGDSLARSGRPIVYSLSAYGLGEIWKWGPETGANLWRTTGDISSSFASMYDNATLQESTAPYAGPGRWNDPDMLEVGNDGLNAAESRFHMSLWALLAAPLIAGNDLRTMSAETREMLMNKEVIAVDQDSLGRQAKRLLRQANLDVWVKPLANGGWCVGFFNTELTPVDASINWRKLGLPAPRQIRDLWLHQDLQTSGPDHRVHLEAHSVQLVRIQ